MSAMSDTQPPGFDEVTAHYELQCPDELRALLPIKYVLPPPNYYPLKTFGLGVLEGSSLGPEFPDICSDIPLGRLTWMFAGELSRPYGVPTFFVTPELVAAALRTELDEALILFRLQWPFRFCLLFDAAQRQCPARY